MERKLSIKKLLKVTAEVFECSVNDILKGNRLFKACDARTAICAILRENGYITSDIMKIVGRKKGSVSSMLVKHHDFITINKQYRNKYIKIKESDIYE